MNAKDHHKELKKKVNVLEQQRRNDRSSTLWTQIKEMKKLKLQAKDKLNAIKSKLHAS